MKNYQEIRQRLKSMIDEATPEELALELMKFGMNFNNGPKFKIHIIVSDDRSWVEEFDNYQAACERIDSLDPCYCLVKPLNFTIK